MSDTKPPQRLNRAAEPIMSDRRHPAALDSFGLRAQGFHHAANAAEQRRYDYGNGWDFFGGINR